MDPDHFVNIFVQILDAIEQRPFAAVCVLIAGGLAVLLMRAR